MTRPEIAEAPRRLPPAPLRPVEKPSQRAPRHLRLATRGWWESVVRDFELEPHHERLLTLAAESWDRVVEARETVKRDGSYFNDRFGQPKAHPALAIERDSRISFARLLRELALDVEPPESRGPGIRR